MGQGHFDFGGSWTDEKLERVRKYLAAYVIALKHQSFELHYVDAFAGSAAAPVELEEVSGEILSIYCASPAAIQRDANRHLILPLTSLVSEEVNDVHSIRY